MRFIPYPDHVMDELLPAADQDRLDPDLFRQLGAMVVRRAVPSDLVERWTAVWQAFYAAELAAGRSLNPYNQVVLNEPVPPELEDIHRHPVLLDLMGQLYPDLGLYWQRFVIKDKHNREPVFLHQDYPYNLGWPDKTSLFLPLGHMNPENGGLVLYPGTHHLGYLGDAGELDGDILDPDWPHLAPSLEPGDVVLMHDCTWHSSPPRVSDTERILVQITYQPANDPSTAVVLRGRQDSAYSMAGIDRRRFFRRSRADRLQELQKEVDELTR